jgi:hypothetical protein
MMNKHYTMTTSFESEKNRKAFLYTVFICGMLLLMFVLISWKDVPPTAPVALDLIEINLGNNEEGFGEEQPLIKGERSPLQEATVVPQQTAAVRDESEDKVNPDDNAEADAAPVNKPVKTTKIITTPTTKAPVTIPAPKPQKAKVTYNGPGTGGGNNATEDNGYKYQGNKPGGTGDAGDPSGNKDSYGNTPGGKVGGFGLISNRRKILNFPSFTSDLKKATIYAQIKISESGRGTFVKLVKPSTTFEQAYANKIIEALRSIPFDKYPEETIETIRFNFTVK